MQHEVPFEPEAVLHELYSLEQIVSSIAAGSWAGGGGGGDAQLPARFSADDAAAGLQEWHDQSGAQQLAGAQAWAVGVAVFPEEGAAVPALVCWMTRGIGGGRCLRLQLVFFLWLAAAIILAPSTPCTRADSEEWSEEEDGLDSRTRKRLERTSLSSTPGRRPTPGGGGSARRRSGAGGGGGGGAAGLSARGSSGSLSAGVSGRRR